MDPFVTYIGAVLIALAGGAFHGFAGFGSGMLMAPLLTLIFPPDVAVPVLIVVSFVGSLRLLHLARGDVNRRRVANLALPALLSLPIGLIALDHVSPAILRQAVASIVLVLVVVLAAGFSVRGARRPGVLAGAGFVSGFLTGIGGVGGPPVVLTLLSVDDPAPHTRANLIAYFTVTELVAIVMMLFMGALTEHVLVLCALTAPAFVIAMHVGSHFFVRSKARAYRSVALSFLAVVAIASLLLGLLAS